MVLSPRSWVAVLLIAELPTRDLFATVGETGSMHSDING